MIAEAAEKAQQCHKYFLQYSTLASDRPQVRTYGWKTCFLPRALSNLVASLSTHHCRSPTTTLNGCGFNRSTGTPFSEQEYSYLTASKSHPSTPYSHNTPQSFSRGTRPYTHSRGRQHMCIGLWHVPRISRNFAGVKICSVVLRPRRKPHWVSSSLGSIIFAASWHALPLGGLEKR